jgi:hypothetical protein
VGLFFIKKKKKKNLTVVYLTTATSVGNKNSGKFSGSLAFLSYHVTCRLKN